MFMRGQKIMLKTVNALIKEFGIGGEKEMYDILTNPPITFQMEEYLGTEVTIKERCLNMDAYHIEEDAEGWGFPTNAFLATAEQMMKIKKE